MLKRYLNNFKKNHKSKGVQLIEYLEKNPSLSTQALAQQLYGTPNSKAFFMLRQRVIERMLLIMQLNISAVDSDMQAQLSQQLLQAQLLEQRGLRNMAKAIYQKCLALAETIALPELKLSALRRLQQLASDASYSQSMMICQESDKAIQNYRTQIQVTQALTQLRGEWFDGVLKAAPSSLPEVQAYPGHEWLPPLLHANHALRNSQLVLAKKFLSESEQTLSRAQAPLPHEASAYLLLIKARLLLQQGNYSAALFRRILERNDQSALRPHLYFLGKLALYFEGKPLGLANSSPEGTIAPLGAFYPLLQSLSLFVSDRQPQAAHLFHQLPSALFSRTYQALLRFYEIMLLIDTQKQDIASYRLESLRKHIANHPCMALMDRYYVCFKELEKASFDFKACKSFCQTTLRLPLTNPACEHPLLRLIPIPQWFEARASKVPLIPFIGEQKKTLESRDKV